MRNFRYASRARATVNVFSAVVSMVILCASGPAFGQTAAQLNFSPDGGSFGCDDTIIVSLMVDDVGDLRGYSLVLEFDPSFVQPISVTAGALLADAACPHFVDWLNATAVGDSIVIDAATLGCSVAGPGEIVRMEFEGLADGISYLRCRPDENFLRDGDNAPVDFDCIDTTIHYMCPVATRRASWHQIKAIYR